MTTAVNNAVDRIAADVRQLADPIHVAVRGRVVTHPPLLVQLREACAPGGAAGGEIRRGVPSSRPPGRLDPLDALSWIYVGVSEWRTRMGLASPARDDDWQLAMLRAIAAAAPALDLPRAEWLAVDVREWWWDAAVFSGWRPTDLLKLR